MQQLQRQHSEELRQCQEEAAPADSKAERLEAQLDSTKQQLLEAEERANIAAELSVEAFQHLMLPLVQQEQERAARAEARLDHSRRQLEQQRARAEELEQRAEAAERRAQAAESELRAARQGRPHPPAASAGSGSTGGSTTAAAAASDREWLRDNTNQQVLLLLGSINAWDSTPFNQPWDRLLSSAERQAALDAADVVLTAAFSIHRARTGAANWDVQPLRAKGDIRRARQAVHPDKYGAAPAFVAELASLAAAVATWPPIWSRPAWRSAAPEARRRQFAAAHLDAAGRHPATLGQHDSPKMSRHVCCCTQCTSPRGACAPFFFSCVGDLHILPATRCYSLVHAS